MMIYIFIFSPIPVMGQHFTLGAGPTQIMGQHVLPRLYGCRRLWRRLSWKPLEIEAWFQRSNNRAYGVSNGHVTD